jgi:predicted  nucleic acid-binding Zn-ribbon protein
MSSSGTRAGEMTVPVSIGEVLDKITILQIKSERLRDEAKLRNVGDELRALTQAFDGQFPVLDDEIKRLVAALKAVNETLWEIEDDIRECERRKSFDARFIELARAVYQTNDERAALKREINVRLGSQLIEEKSYTPYA